MMNAALKALCKVASLAVALVLGGGSAAWANGLKAEPLSKVTLATALADAHRMAAKTGDRVLRVEGASMLPYFGDGSVLVVRAAAVDSLRPGMVVVYRNNLGETVAHRIEARAGEGWRVRGANNGAVDSTLVTGRNLVGTVYVTLHSDPRGGAEALRLAGALADATEVALAAPAR